MNKFRYRFDFSVLRQDDSVSVIGPCVIGLTATNLSMDKKPLRTGFVHNGLSLEHFLQALNYGLDELQRKIKDEEHIGEANVNDV